jgi:hypothetical protein
MTRPRPKSSAASAPCRFTTRPRSFARGVADGRKARRALVRIGAKQAQKGSYCSGRGIPRPGEDLYREALNIAPEREAKRWELRAAASLARLYCDQVREAEAHDLLAPIYGWFTEDLKTQDLKEAKALLDDVDQRG